MACDKITASTPLCDRPLANWKTWWGKDLAVSIAKAFSDHIDPTGLPGHGQLLTQTSFTGECIKEQHTASLLEAMLVSYPSDRQPSSYLLGDAVIALDNRWNGSLLGGPKTSPIMERQRRDAALAEGGRLKALLSYIRTSALKSDQGKTEQVTYLKSLANKRTVRVNRRPSSVSVASSSPSTSSETILILGQEAPNTIEVEDHCESVFDQTMMLLGLDPNQACSQFNFEQLVMAELGPDAAYFKCPVSMEGDSAPPEITPVDDAEPISNDVEGPKDVENISKGSHADNGVQVQVDQKVPETHIETAAAAACKELSSPFTSTPLPAPVRPDMSLTEVAPDAANPRDQLRLVVEKKSKTDSLASESAGNTSVPGTKAEVSDPAPKAAKDLGAVNGALPIPEGMPACAYPQGYRKGRLSYTIVSPTTNARIEVLLKGKAFRIQRIGERDGESLREKPAVMQKPWMGDIQTAWNSVVEAAAWE